MTKSREEEKAKGRDDSSVLRRSLRGRLEKQRVRSPERGWGIRYSDGKAKNTAHLPPLGTPGRSHLRNPPQLEENQMVPACPHKDYETARGFGQDVCKIPRYYSYLTGKQKPFKNITPQSCEFNWDSPKSFPLPLSSLAIICSAAL